MSHNKIKAAARRRMTATGEPYVAARRQSISEHNAAQSTSPVSADDIRAAAAAEQELGPAYSDAVVAAFIDRVNQAVAARVEARLAGRASSVPAKVAGRGQRRLARRLARDVVAASAGAALAVGAVGLYDVNRPHPGPPASRSANGACTGPRPCFVPSSTNEVRTYIITREGQLTAVVSAPDDAARG